jgi:phosphoglycerate dehydrogenase-like enzyme
MRRIKVLMTNLSRSLTQEQLNQLQRISARIEIVQRSTGEQWGKTDSSPLFDGDEEVFYGFLPPSDLSAAPSLKWIQLVSAGINQLSSHPILHSNVSITTASGIHAVPIGEFAISMMLALARHVPRMVRMQDRGEWPRDRWSMFVGSELHGRTLGVVGYGSIGREAARIAKQGFGMKVLALTRTLHKEDRGYVEKGVGDPRGRLPDKWFKTNQLLALLARSDFVVICVPLTNETRNMIAEEEMQVMKPSAFIVNVARGEIVNEAALVKALKERTIAGAGLDVFAVEPLPYASELWALENALIAPHVSGISPNYDERAVILFAENLRRYVHGKKLLNLVDVKNGY